MTATIFVGLYVYPNILTNGEEDSIKKRQKQQQQLGKHNTKPRKKVVRFSDEDTGNGNNHRSSETVIYYQDELDPQERGNLWLQTKDLSCIRNCIRSTVLEYFERHRNATTTSNDSFDEDDDHGVCVRGIEKFVCDHATRTHEQAQKNFHRNTILKYYYDHKEQMIQRNNIHKVIAGLSSELSKFAQLRAENRAFQDQLDARKVYENNDNQKSKKRKASAEYCGDYDLSSSHCSPRQKLYKKWIE